MYVVTKALIRIIVTALSEGVGVQSLKIICANLQQIAMFSAPLMFYLV